MFCSASLWLLHLPLSFVQESGDALSRAKSAAERSAGECKRLGAECQRLKDELIRQRQDGQKLRDEMVRVSLKCRTDEQVSCRNS